MRKLFTAPFVYVIYISYQQILSRFFIVLEQEANCCALWMSFFSSWLRPCERIYRVHSWKHIRATAHLSLSAYASSRRKRFKSILIKKKKSTLEIVKRSNSMNEEWTKISSVVAMPTTTQESSLCRKLINYKLRSLKCDLNDIKVELSQARAKKTRSIAMIATRRAKCAMWKARWFNWWDFMMIS